MSKINFAILLNQLAKEVKDLGKAVYKSKNKKAKKLFRKKIKKLNKGLKK